MDADIFDKLRYIIQQLDDLKSRLPDLSKQQLDPDLERAKLAESQRKAKEQYERLKKQADEEIAVALKSRKEQGIPDDGDAVRPQDLEILENDFTR